MTRKIDPKKINTSRSAETKYPGLNNCIIKRGALFLDLCCPNPSSNVSISKLITEIHHTSQNIIGILKSSKRINVSFVIGLEINMYVPTSRMAIDLQNE